MYEHDDRKSWAAIAVCQQKTYKMLSSALFDSRHTTTDILETEYIVNIKFRFDISNFSLPERTVYVRHCKFVFDYFHANKIPDMIDKNNLLLILW